MLRAVLLLLMTCLGVFASGDSFAQKKIFLSPQKSGERSSNSATGNASQKEKPRIFLRQHDKPASVFVPPSPRPLKREGVGGVPRSKVFKNNLSIYNSRAFKNLDPYMLSAAGPVPKTAEEIKLVAAAHRLSRVQALAQMDRALSRPLPVVEVKRKNVDSAEDRSVDNRALVYEQPKPRVLPYRIFGR